MSEQIEKEQIEKDKIYNCDCLEGMKHIPDGSIDAIICDLPYGTIKNIPLEGWERACKDTSWDECIPTDQLFEQYERILRMNGVIVLFSQEPFTTHLRSFKTANIEFLYPMIWLKNKHANNLMCNQAPLSYFEDINVFAKKYDTQMLHPLRDYFAKTMEYIGKTKREIINEIGQRADHVFRGDSTQFALCTKETYQALIEHYGIDKMQGFRSYEELESMNAKFQRTFNLPQGATSKSNVLRYPKDTDGFHPTQKPVALIADLIRTYSNEGDTILDNCMGSGTTAVACIKEKRHFIGFELNKDYYDKACRRIDAERRQLSLF